MSKELAAYIADYVNREYRKAYHNHRNGTFPSITDEMILKAIEAYETDAENHLPRLIKEIEDRAKSRNGGSDNDFPESKIRGV